MKTINRTFEDLNLRVTKLETELFISKFTNNSGAYNVRMELNYSKFISDFNTYNLNIYLNKYFTGNCQLTSLAYFNALINWYNYIFTNSDAITYLKKYKDLMSPNEFLNGIFYTLNETSRNLMSSGLQILMIDVNDAFAKYITEFFPKEYIIYEFAYISTNSSRMVTFYINMRQFSIDGNLKEEDYTKLVSILYGVKNIKYSNEILDSKHSISSRYLRRDSKYTRDAFDNQIIQGGEYIFTLNYNGKVYKFRSRDNRDAYINSFNKPIEEEVPKVEEVELPF